MLYVEEPPAAAIEQSPSLSLERKFLRDIVGLSAEPTASQFLATKYPMPDGSRHDVVFRSFPIWHPETLTLAKDEQPSTDKLLPVVQWLARVPGDDERSDDVVSITVRGHELAGRVSFGSQHYEQAFDAGETTALTHTRLRQAVPRSGWVVAQPRFKHFFQGDVLIADLALMADFALTTDFGSVGATVNAMLGMVADLNAIYFRDLEAVFNLTFLGIENVANTPDGLGRYEFRSRVHGQEARVTGKENFESDWRDNYRHVQRDLAVLVSKHYVISAQTGPALGLADVGNICDNNAAYALFRYSSDFNTRTYRAAHEIGHSFGAIHTNCTPDPASQNGFVDGCDVAQAPPGQPPPPCFPGPNPEYPQGGWGTIMSLCPYIDLRFHPLSAAMIASELTSKACLQPASLKLVENDVPERSLGSPFGQPLYFAIDVPEHVVGFRIETTGGSGDVDLYAQRRTLNVFATWPSASPGNDEQIVIPPPVQPGRWYIRLEPAPSVGHFSDVQLTAVYQDAVVLQNNVPHTEYNVAASSVTFFKLEVPVGGVRRVTLTASSPSGLFVFAVRLGRRPDMDRPIENAFYDDSDQPHKTYATMQGHQVAGLWYVGVHALADLAQLQVTISYEV